MKRKNSFLMRVLIGLIYSITLTAEELEKPPKGAFVEATFIVQNKRNSLVSQLDKTTSLLKNAQKEYDGIVKRKKELDERSESQKEQIDKITKRYTKQLPLRVQQQLNYLKQELQKITHKRLNCCLQIKFNEFLKDFCSTQKSELGQLIELLKKYIAQLEKEELVDLQQIKNSVEISFVIKDFIEFQMQIIDLIYEIELLRLNLRKNKQALAYEQDIALALQKGFESTKSSKAKKARDQNQKNIIFLTNRIKADEKALVNKKKEQDNAQTFLIKAGQELVLKGNEAQINADAFMKKIELVKKQLQGLQ